ncbi:MAG: hypothetical protein H7336_01115 [Bacteriovorax sp.]|nr:hypothetical protein [Bacteriovorax sp.]
MLLLTTLASCSLFRPTPEVVVAKPLSFHDKKNCSTKAYAYVNKRDEAREKKITLYEHNQLQIRTVDYLVEKEADLQSCYTDKSREFYACAVVGINSKAKVEFLDVSDEVNKLDANLKNCLEKKLQSYNYKALKAKTGTKFTIPLKFNVKNLNYSWSN